MGLHDVRGADGGRSDRLTFEARQERGVRGDLRSQDLHCHPTLDEQVLGLEDHTEATGAQLALDPVAADEPKVST